MKVELFKKLIKEAVSEAVREELTEILKNNNPTHIQENRTLSFNSGDVSEVRNNLHDKMSAMFGFNSPTTNNNNLNVDYSSANPFMSFLEDSAKNLTPQERAGLSNL